MNYRCFNDLFNYYTGKPEPTNQTTTFIVGLGNGCTKDHATCGNYLKESELNKDFIKQPKDDKPRQKKGKQ